MQVLRKFLCLKERWMNNQSQFIAKMLPKFAPNYSFGIGILFLLLAKKYLAKYFSSELSKKRLQQ